MEFLLGNECIARGAIDAGAHSAYAYPGTPSSEILSSFREYAPDRFTQWSINEKTALECAIAEAISGKKILCAMKQVGLNASADPLFSSAYTGVRGALVIVSADDPGPYSSQTEQDSRMYAHAARLPVFDPASPKDAYHCTLKAFELSARFSIPVIIRPVMRVCHSREGVDLRHEHPTLGQFPSFERNVPRWAATPKFRAELHTELLDKLDRIANDNVIKINAKNEIAIVASGYAWSLAKDIENEFEGKFDLIKVEIPYPIATDSIEKIESLYTKIIILEETFPVIENQFLDKRKVIGKWNKLVPSKGEMTVDTVRSILHRALGKTQADDRRVAHPPLPAARPTLCAGCGHRAAFYSIKKTFPAGIFPSDIGCYTLGVNIGAVDTVLVMGAAVSFAEALSRANPEKPVIATIGDSTFFHSGIPPLINAIAANAPFVLAILDNTTTAMTGFQPVPHDGKSPVTIEGVLTGIGVSFIKVIDPYLIDDSIQLTAKAHRFASENKTPAVIIFRHPCVTKDRIKGKALPAINDRCKNCRICYEKFECPALYEDKESNRAAVNERLCTRCGVCVSVCPFSAIREDSHA
ncbi:MAG TPA: thiamine pyrophosphate-dependent enzyme [Spirochaetota bacterium]